mmetsp:Transcript_134690/g.234032  ORF Transcript_134690/g.234032 Transcript_134690/m.234032 type:complete len:462 (-) Transcript_134690:90-1475(-)
MYRRRSNSLTQAARHTVGAVELNQQSARLFNLYDVRKDGYVYIADFDFVHSLANQLMCGSSCNFPPPMIGSSNRSFSKMVADGSTVSKGKPDKSCLLRSPLLEEYAKATFGTVDLDSDGCISRHDFHSWLGGLMARTCKGSGDDQKRSKILLQHLVHMLQADKKFLAFRSLVLSAKRAAMQDSCRQMLVAISDFQEALGSAEGIVENDNVLVQFQQQLIERQLDLKQRLRDALAAAETLQARESALREVMQAKSALPFEPRELRELKQYKEMVNASHQPFTVHISTIAGPEARIEVSHDDTVWDLRTRVAAELNQGHHAYQTTLSNMRGKLENDSATLRECLLCSSKGEELVATYAKADRWVELSHPEFEEFRRKESNESVRLYRAAEEAERKARLHKSEGNIAESMVKKVEACCHKTWQEATFEDLLIETVGMFNHDYGRRRQALKRMVKGLRSRGLVEN